MVIGAGGDLLFQNDAGSNLGVWKQSGNVGIGTTGPKANLHIASGTGQRLLIGSDTTSNYPLAIFDSGGGGGDFMAYIRNATTNKNAHILFYALDSGAIYRGSGLGFDPNNQGMYFGDVGAANLFVKTSGNVGIGTTVPSTKLDVQGGDINTSGKLKESGNSLIPTGAVMFFNLAACPSGWTEYTALRGRIPVGLPSGGTLAGNNAATSFTDLQVYPNWVGTTGSNYNTFQAPGNLNGGPPTHQLLACQKD
jgi:hypothetical protein